MQLQLYDACSYVCSFFKVIEFCLLSPPLRSSLYRNRRRMPSSTGVASSASSRGFFNFNFENVPEDYRVVFPPLSRRGELINTCFSHSDVGGRPYRAENFGASLDEVGVLADTVYLGAYQMNHLWIVTLKTTETKRKPLAANEVLVKGKDGLFLTRARQWCALKSIGWPTKSPTTPSARR